MVAIYYTHNPTPISIIHVYVYNIHVCMCRASTPCPRVPPPSITPYPFTTIREVRLGSSRTADYRITDDDVAFD